MARITGIGGIFFRAKDPSSLAIWYERHLGITPPGPDMWRQEAGPTVFSAFSERSVTSLRTSSGC